MGPRRTGHGHMDSPKPDQAANAARHEVGWREEGWEDG